MENWPAFLPDWFDQSAQSVIRPYLATDGVAYESRIRGPNVFHEFPATLKLLTSRQLQVFEYFHGAYLANGTAYFSGKVWSDSGALSGQALRIIGGDYDITNLGPKHWSVTANLEWWVNA